MYFDTFSYCSGTYLRMCKWIKSSIHTNCWYSTYIYSCWYSTYVYSLFVDIELLEGSTFILLGTIYQYGCVITCPPMSDHQVLVPPLYSVNFILDVVNIVYVVSICTLVF